MICYKFNYNRKYVHHGFYSIEAASDFPSFHTHEYWECFICSRGSFEHSIEGSSEVFEVGDVILLAPGEGHSFTGKTTDAAHIDFEITDETFRQKCAFFSSNLYDFFLRNRRLRLKFSLQRMKTIESHLKSMKVSNSEDEAETLVGLSVFNLIEAVFDQFSNQLSQMPEWFKDLLIQCNSLEHLNWKAHDVCEYANYSQTHINRAFHRFFNTTLVDYLTEIKMNNAATLLTNTDMSLADIVSTLGYNSTSHFSRTFKEMFKVSPYQYKLSFRKASKS